MTQAGDSAAVGRQTARVAQGATARAKTLGVFAPSGPYDPDRFERGLARLRNHDFEVYVPEGVAAREGYLAGSDQHRVDGLVAAFEHPDIDVWIAARGGYGLQRILPQLAKRLPLKKQSKHIIGFSDVTALHQLLLQAGHTCLHGPVVTQLADLEDEDVASLVRALEGHTQEFDGLTSVHPKTAEGPLVGGNLSMMSTMVGTPYLQIPDGAVLLLEDVGERPYRIDRMLTHLRLSGVLERVSAVVLGDFVDCEPPNGVGPTTYEVLQERLAPLRIPVVSGVPVGHGPRNRTLKLGGHAFVDADRGTLVVS